MATPGFAPNAKTGATPTPARGRKKPKTTPPNLIQEFKNILPGELAAALPLAFAAIGIKGFTKIPTIAQGMFGPIEVPFETRMVDVPGSKEVVEVPWGRWSVPGLGEVEPTQDYYDGHVSKLICYQGDKDEVEVLWPALILAVKELVPTITLFRGRAFQVKSKNDLISPRYIDLTKEVRLEVNEDVMEEIDLNIFSVLRHHAALKAAGVRMKRGVVLEGHYGSGKTLLAYQTAQAANEFGQTFIMVSAENALRGYKVALNRQPSVLFIEDLDSNATGNRDDLNSLLNTLSGVETKGDVDLLLMVSTNFIHRIDPAFLRPERLGAIIQMTLPNQGTIGRILLNHLSGALEVCSEEDFSTLCTSLVGATPAIITEVAERAKIHSIRTGAQVPLSLLNTLVLKMARQRELALPVYKGETNAEKLQSSLAKAVVEGYRD